MYTVIFGETTPMDDVYAFIMGLWTLFLTIVLTEFVAKNSALLHVLVLRNALLPQAKCFGKWLCLFTVGGYSSQSYVPYVSIFTSYCRSHDYFKEIINLKSQSDYIGS